MTDIYLLERAVGPQEPRAVKAKPESGFRARKGPEKARRP
jgi:hypothetical protein